MNPDVPPPVVPVAAAPPVAVAIPPIPHDPEEAFLHVLEHIVGLDTQAKRDRVTINGGVTTIDELLVVEIDILIGILTANTSVLAKTRLKTLKQWGEQEYDLEGYVDVGRFTAEVCRERQRAIAKSTRASTDQDKGTQSKDKLPTFNGKRESWLRSKRELTAYLNQIRNENGVPIYYVIRDPDQEEQYRADNGEVGRKIYEEPFRGRIYDQDAFKVLQILRQWTSGGTADTFVDNSNDVQGAWAQLIRNYEGHDARSANIQKARDVIATAHWIRNTQNFTFDDYCNRHVKANNELDRYGSNVDGESQVNAFLKGIRTDTRQNPHLLAIKTIILNGETTRGNLRNAIISFKDTMRQIVGASNDRESRNVGAFHRNNNNGGRGGAGRGGSGRGGRFDGRGGGRLSGRGHGRNARQHGGRYQAGRSGRGQRSDNYIPDSVLQAVGPRYQAMLLRGRDQMEKESNSGGGKVNEHNTTNARNASASHVTSISEVTEAEQQLHNNNEDIDGGASSHFGYTGNKKRRTINTVRSSNRRIGKAIKVEIPNDYNKVSRCEIDTRADTICAGSTFLLHEDTGKIVDVTGFHESLEPIKGIKVGTCITAIDLTNETIIASFPQSLYFGSSMEHSLLPPAQLWDYGITVDVVPKQYSDGNSLHGIHHYDENIFIPFHLNGCISYFSTRLPTHNEIKSCRWITFTSDNEWNPYSDHFADAERAMISHNRFPDPRHLHFDPTGNPIDGRSFGSVYVDYTNACDMSNSIPLNPEIDTFDTIFALTTMRTISATSSTEHRSSVPIEVLARRWGTSVGTAKQTIDVTTQRGIRSLQGPLTRRFRTRQKQLQNRYLNTNMYTDTFFMSSPSARGHTCFQLFITSEGFVAGQPLKSKADAYEVLEFVCRTYGVPKVLVSDGAKEETLGNWGRIVKQNLIRQRITEPHSGWQNRCEDEIREVRKHYARIMSLHQCPDAFWDFGFEYVIILRQMLARTASNHRSPYETTIGDTPDISEFLDFDFYQWIKFRDSMDDKDHPIKLGRWLGIAHNVGTPLTYWILKDNGQVIARSTVRPLLTDEVKSEAEGQLRTEFNNTIKDKYGSFDPQLLNVFDNEDITQPTINDIVMDTLETPFNSLLDDDTPGGDQIRPVAGVGDNNNTDDLVSGPDPFNSAQIILPRGDRNELAKVIGRKRNNEGNFIGRAHKNPILDSRIFTVRFADGEEKDVAYNVLAEHLFSQVDSEGNQYRIFKEIINHRRKDNATTKEDQFRISKDGRRVQKKTVAGWDIEVEWKDGSTSWIPLKEIKETNAVEVAQYARDNRIIEEPAFSWWAPIVLKKLVRLIKLSKSRHIKRGFKFGIRVPVTIEEAIQYDKENGDQQWYNAIMKEMSNVRVAFEQADKPHQDIKR